MKTNTLIAGILIAALNALVLMPALSQYGAYFLAGSIALALWLVLKAALYKEPQPAEPATELSAERPRATAAPAAAPKHSAEAEVLAVVGSLQSKGRLVDFLMDDIGKYSDAQVGSAARVVHQGCKAAFDELFTVAPVASEQEGARVTVSAESVNEYRLLGKVSGEPPFTGTLIHKGWKATRVNLPRVIKVEDDGLPPIAPAQVEIK